MKKIKVFRVIARLNIGGPAIHAILLTDGLNKEKFQSLLVAGVVDANEGDMLYLAQAKTVQPVIIPELARKICLKDDLIAFWKLYKLLTSENPDILHTHTAKAGALGRCAAILYNISQKKPKIKLIHTFHGHILEGYFGRIKSGVFIWIELVLAKFTDKIVVVSQKIRSDLLNLGIGRQSQIVVIPLGLELEGLLRLDCQKCIKPVVKIGIIGRLVPIKNQGMFLSAAKKIIAYSAALKDNNAKWQPKFFIVGDGELRGKLEEHAQELGINSEVVFTGWQKDLEKVYQYLDIVALTSLNEGTPVSLIEAMAAGCPVIATDCGGIKDLLGDSQRGIVIKVNDEDALVAGLIRIIEDKALRNRIINSARDFVKNKFNKERLISDIEMLYNITLKKEPNSCVR